MEWRWWGVCVEGGSINLREWVEWWCRGGYSTEGIRGCWSIVYADIDVVLCGMGMIVKYMSSSIRHFILLWVFSHFEPQQLIIVVILYYCRNEPKSQTLCYLIPFSCPFMGFLEAHNHDQDTPSTIRECPPNGNRHHLHPWNGMQNAIIASLPTHSA